MKKLSLIIAAVFVFGVTNVVKADDKEAEHQVTIGIETHALVDVETSLDGGSSAISLSPSAPTEAGEGLDFTNTTNSNLWLNYSSIVSSNSSKNTISAKIVGSLPAGVKLQLKVGTCTTGTGNVGSPKSSNAIDLTGTNKEVVHNIRSSYTGNGGNNGHQLTYSLVEDFSNSTNYGDLMESSSAVEVVYTITEN